MEKTTATGTDTMALELLAQAQYENIHLERALDELRDANPTHPANQLVRKVGELLGAAHRALLGHDVTHARVAENLKLVEKSYPIGEATT